MGKYLVIKVYTGYHLESLYKPSAKLELAGESTLSKDGFDSIVKKLRETLFGESDESRIDLP